MADFFAGLTDFGWSPDGRSVVFAQGIAGHFDIRVREEQSGRTEVLPGSEGLLSPRWSPSGKHISAQRLTPDKRFDLLTYDVETRRWTLLYDGGDVDWPIWSPDGTALYFHLKPLSTTEPQGIYRLRLADRQLQLVWKKPPDFVGGGGVVPSWWTLAPDGSILTIRNASTNAIYALDWEAP